ERNNTWNTPYLFNAKEFDEETGLYYYGARYYEPRLSLWMSVDRFQEKYPNISTYCFSANNPIGILDIGGDSLRIDNKNLSLLYIDGKLYRQNGIQYTDKLKGFTKKVVSALDVLRKGTEGASMISELQSSSNNFVIKDGASEFKASNVTKAYAQQIQNDPSATAQKEALLNNGIDLSGGSGGTISWNSHGAVLATSEGGQVSKETDLAHEMFHALDANRGLLDSRSENGIERSEWQAVFRENILREQLGRPLRTHYITNMDQDGNFVKGSGPSMLSDKNKPILPVWYKR
ncbi:MAG: M91 family zinc metallopeptidase, partial [Prevotella sp.]|nr:M91 family zinc metallopeptidase [Prevotella sp.]